jgi:hypothetical protein
VTSPPPNPIDNKKEESEKQQKPKGSLHWGFRKKRNQRSKVQRDAIKKGKAWKKRERMMEKKRVRDELSAAEVRVHNRREESIG